MRVSAAAALALLALSTPLRAEIHVPAILWERALPGEARGFLSAGGLVLVLSEPGGGQDWRLGAYRILTGGAVWEIPAPPGAFIVGAADDLAILVAGEEARALDPATGRRRWAFRLSPDATRPAGRLASAASDGDGVYLSDYAPGRQAEGGGGPSTFYRLDPASGARLWSATLPSGALAGGLSVAGDAVVALGVGGATAVSKRDGTRRWSVRADTVGAAPAAGAGAAFLPVSGLEAVSLETGSLLWIRRSAPMPFGPRLLGGVLYAPLPQLGTDVSAPAGELKSYVSASPRHVPTFVALEPASGKELWERAFPGELRSGTLAGKSAYVACSDGNLYRLDLRDGGVIWKQGMGFSNTPGDPIVWKGLLALAGGRQLVAVGESRK